MTPQLRLRYTLILIVMGAGWGLTQPFSKIAVSTGYGHFGLVFWQLVLGAVLMGLVCLVRRTPLPFSLRHLRLYLIIALIGTVLPNTMSYQAAVHLPSGIMSLLLSVIPMFAFGIALLMGNDSFAMRRMVGLLFGLCGVLMIILPSVDLGQPVPVFWAGIYLLTALCYAFEGNYVAKWGTQGLDPFQVMLGSSLVGILVTVPLMINACHYITPIWPLPEAQRALVITSVVHVLVYACYVWLVGRAGAVFSTQVSYLVTGFGLFWAWLILGEAYAQTLAIALAVIFVGMYLVQPREKAEGAT